MSPSSPLTDQAPHAADRRFSVGDRIPAVLTKRELADGLGLSVWQLDEYRRLKNHPAIKELEGPGHPRFSGRAVRVWLETGCPQPKARHFLVAARGR